MRTPWGGLSSMLSAEAFGRVQLGLTMCALVGAPLAFGSVDPSWLTIWSIVLSTSVLCGLGVPVGPQQRGILLLFLAVCGVYAVVALLQVAPNVAPRLNDPVWQRLRDLTGSDVMPRISSRAQIPAPAVGHFILVVASFVNGFLIGTSRRRSQSLVWCLRISIVLSAIYGLANLLLTPNLILWAPKTAYQGYLTTTFINHNTAATFLGTGTILWSYAVVTLLQSFKHQTPRLLLLMPSNERLATRLLLYSTAALLCFFAVVLTGSRAGLIATCLGTICTVTLMIGRPRGARPWQVASYALLCLAIAIVWLSGFGRIGSEGLFDGGRWQVYNICVRAILDRPLLGAGAGTFADLFPSLRTSDLSSWGTWDFAHSTILEIAVEMGIPVSIMILAAVATSLYLLGRGALRLRNASRGLSAAVFGIATLGFLHSAIDFSLQIPGYMVVFFTLIGCGLARVSSTRDISRSIDKARQGQLVVPLERSARRSG